MRNMWAAPISGTMATSIVQTKCPCIPSIPTWVSADADGDHDHHSFKTYHMCTNWAILCAMPLPLWPALSQQLLLNPSVENIVVSASLVVFFFFFFFFFAKKDLETARIGSDWIGTEHYKVPLMVMMMRSMRNLNLHNHRLQSWLSVAFIAFVGKRKKIGVRRGGRVSDRVFLSKGSPQSACEACKIKSAHTDLIEATEDEKVQNRVRKHSLGLRKRRWREDKKEGAVCLQPVLESSRARPLERAREKRHTRQRENEKRQERCDVMWCCDDWSGENWGPHHRGLWPLMCEERECAA